jgi:Spy/CpxP family protein refolding chaperone
MKRSLLLLALLSMASCARSERAPLPVDPPAPPRPAAVAAPSAPREPLSAIEARLYPAELVMEHQAAIALLPAQRATITKEVERSQTELVELQWDLQARKDELVNVLGDVKVDEARSKTAADALLKAEDAIKGAHLGLLVRIKNVLTGAQQAKLAALREEARCGPPTGNDAGHE